MNSTPPESAVQPTESSILPVTPKRKTRYVVVSLVVFGFLSAAGFGVYQYVIRSSGTGLKTSGNKTAADNGKVATVNTTTFPVSDQQKAAYIAQLQAADSLAKAEAVLNSFAAAYGFKISASPAFTSAGWEAIASWQPPSEQNLSLVKDYGTWFLQEWTKYPKEWVAKTGIQKIVFANDLVLTGSNQAVSGFVDYGHPWIFLNLATAEQGQNNAVRVLHHEYAHLIDNVYVNSIGLETTWRAFNPPAFVYVSESVGEGAAVTQFLKHPQPGFVSNIAELDVPEDRAEVYSYLFSTPHYQLLQTWLADDPYLQKKVGYYKGLIKDALPGMDDTYFARINQ